MLKASTDFAGNNHTVLCLPVFRVVRKDKFRSVFSETFGLKCNKRHE